MIAKDKVREVYYLCSMIRLTVLIPILALILFTSSCKNSSQEAIKAKRKEEMTNKENRVSPPATASATIGENTVTVNYSSPSVKGRQIWGALVPYDQVWRTGANEATTVTFTQDVTIQGQVLSTDIYSLFTIPGEAEWTVIFNWNERQWGAFKYDQAEDALRVSVKPTATEILTEHLTFSVVQDSVAGSGILRMNWEKLQLDVPFSNIAEK